MDIKFKKLVPEAQIPYHKYDNDAGFDLTAVSMETTKDYIEYKTGIAVQIPKGYVGLIFPRSSVTTYDLILKNCVGVIDADYLGEIRCRYYNTTNLRNVITLETIPAGKIYSVGDRVAQILFLELPKITLVEAKELSDTLRGEGGFGHTGK